MSDWQQRTRESIKFTSPDGNTFEAQWRSNTTTQEKNLGIYNYPKVQGSVVQDLGLKSARYPMIVYFDGPNNDIESQKFMIALRQTGPWTVIHPVLGEKILQPISFSPDINPIGSGNITAITTEWIEPISDAVITSIQELEARIREQQQALNQQSANQYDETVSQDEAGETLAIAEETNNVLTAWDETMDSLAQLGSDVYNQVISVKRGMQSAILDPVIDVIALTGQFQGLLELPGLVAQDFEARFNIYLEMANRIIGNTESDRTDSVQKNRIATNEVVLSSIISTMGTLAITSEYQTRPQAVQATEDILNIFSNITNALDNAQSDYADNTIDNQYFSQSQTFSEAALLMGYIIAYIQRITLDLRIEKRFILEKNRAPIEITITEYGDLGENDSNLDLFISSNGLKGNDILLIPAGREVVVYV